MKKESEISNDNLDSCSLEVEKILKPRAEFRVSPGFRQRVMAAAAVESRSGRERWLRRRFALGASWAAAAVIVLVLLGVWHFHQSECSTDKPTVAVSTTPFILEIPTFPDSLNKKDVSPRFIAEAPRHTQEKQPATNGSAERQPTSISGSLPILQSDISDKKNPKHVAEGDMPRIPQDDRPIDPEEVRHRLLEVRRDAEIAYIERMRNEINNNRLNRTQLMPDKHLTK